MADFCTVEDVENLLQIEIADPAKILSCERAIHEATATIQNYCHQTIERVIDDVLTLDCLPIKHIALPELPVVSIESVVENGDLLTAGTDYRLGQYSILYRLGRNWAPGVQNVVITYSHGYNPLPDDIVAVATRMASRIYQAGLKSADSSGLLGVSSKQLGDFSVSYTSEQGGGADQGLMGVSASRMILMSEKDILNRYRYWSA